ncbi:cysteine desulfurase family protein [Magnetofaba australis]|uniref:cysteine desulfurase n=1 Tax=Magnetofaba australis IT-1 TaxID=1434232 RepID=A0A1Y2K333_9PROT|nr:cysteine desulfurase family protein [Magnetofaba australis]OSM02403.1 putative class V aminotransferase [Magnetofaba australis IT-1]
MIYLDHNATSKLRPEALAAMLPFFSEKFGNPSAAHSGGRAAKEGLERARRAVAKLFNVHFSRVIFTSGGTEADNLAIQGVAAANDYQGHIVTTAIEHPAVSEPIKQMVKQGMRATFVEPDAHGVVNAEAIVTALQPDTKLVSIMAANNETGALQPIEEIGAQLAERNIPLHVDAVQMAGKAPLDLERLPIAYVSVSAHKFGGPQGVGALIVEKNAPLRAQLLGGGQERRRRSGTENLPGIVGFGVAAQMASDNDYAAYTRLEAMRDAMEQRIRHAQVGAAIFSADAPRMGNTSALAFPQVNGETLVIKLDLAGFAISSGSACSSGKTEPSHVLRAMGVASELAQGFVRVSLGWDTQPDQVERFTEALIDQVKQLQSMADPALGVAV